jgi:hypothetical protein
MDHPVGVVEAVVCVDLEPQWLAIHKVEDGEDESVVLALQAVAANVAQYGAVARRTKIPGGRAARLRPGKCWPDDHRNSRLVAQHLVGKRQLRPVDDVVAQSVGEELADRRELHGEPVPQVGLGDAERGASGRSRSTT